jgi:hypothetical protein
MQSKATLFIIFSFSAQLPFLPLFCNTPHLLSSWCEAPNVLFSHPSLKNKMRLPKQKLIEASEKRRRSSERAGQKKDDDSPEVGHLPDKDGDVSTSKTEGAVAKKKSATQMQKDKPNSPSDRVNKKRAADDVDPPSALASKKHAADDVDATAINSSDDDGLFAEDEDAISNTSRKSTPKRSKNVCDSEPPAVMASRQTDDEDIEVTNIECTEPHFLRGDIPWILHPCRGSSRSAVYSFCSAITFIGMEALSLKIMLGANNLNLMTNPRNQAAERPGHTLLSQFMNLFAGSLAPHWVLVRAMDSFDPSLHFHPFPVLIITNADELAGFTIYGEWIFVACEKDAIRFSPKRVTDCGYNAQNRRVYLLEPKKESPHSGSGPNESSSARGTNLNSSGVRPPNRRGSGGSHATGTPMPTAAAHGHNVAPANESSYWPTHHPSPATTWSMHPPRG